MKSVSDYFEESTSSEISNVYIDLISEDPFGFFFEYNFCSPSADNDSFDLEFIQFSSLLPEIPAETISQWQTGSSLEELASTQNLEPIEAGALEISEIVPNNDVFLFDEPAAPDMIEPVKSERHDCNGSTSPSSTVNYSPRVMFLRNAPNDISLDRPDEQDVGISIAGSQARNKDDANSSSIAAETAPVTARLGPSTNSWAPGTSVSSICCEVTAPKGPHTFLDESNFNVVNRANFLILDALSDQDVATTLVNVWQF